MTDEPDPQPVDLTPEEIKRRNQQIMLQALVRQGKHVYGMKPRPRRRKNKGDRT